MKGFWVLQKRRSNEPYSRRPGALLGQYTQFIFSAYQNKFYEDEETYFWLTYFIEFIQPFVLNKTKMPLS